jgi:hypothetical protein
MNAFSLRGLVSSLRASVLLAALVPCVSTQARVLDNFDAGKSGWSDFTFNPALGPSFGDSGQLKLELPPVGQSIFIASQKTTELFELKDGRTVEYRIDVVEGGGSGQAGKDSFAVLGFIPKANSPGTLAGYGLALSTTDVLITKGINKYFLTEGSVVNTRSQHPSVIDNVTMVLNLSVSAGTVTIHAMVIDKDDGTVLFDRTVLDTPAQDQLAAGNDDAPPYITSGYYSLYLYEDFDKNAPENPYKVYFDNAQVWVNDTSVLDDFDSGKSGWGDFTFNPALGPSFGDSGLLKFELPPVGQSIFIASQKTTRLFELKEGDRNEFSVDVVEGGGTGQAGKDSFAVLGFIPKANSPGTLAGYGLALSTTDVLITKGINKYFLTVGSVVNNRSQHPGVIDNVTMKLNLEVIDGSVYIHAQVIDKDDGVVLFDHMVIDTPNEDQLAAGKDDAPPYITTGYYSLYLYEDFDRNAPENPYKVYYDNAIVSAPPVVENAAPLITSSAPAAFSNFLPAATDISFTAADDAALDDTKLSITLNGVAYTTANGLVVTGTGGNKTATLSGKLAADQNYAAVLSVIDAGGKSATSTLYFDTFTSSVIVVEAEDYNFDSGVYIDNPLVAAEGSGPDPSGYSLQVGTKLVDYFDTRGSANGTDTKYRTSDSVRMQHSLDLPRSKFTDAGGAEAFVFDYDVGDFVLGEWRNYTRNFPAGTYTVYLREALVNMSSGDTVLELVTSDASQPDQTTVSLGTFLGKLTGFQYRNFPLTDGNGNPITVNLSGATTLRLRNLTSDLRDGGQFQNYMVFVRTGDIQVQPATITSLNPSPGSTITTLAPQIQVQILNHDTTVKPETIQLILNGNSVTPAVTTDATGATVSYTLPELPAVGAVNTAKVSFKDSADNTIQATWQFSITYPSVNPAYLAEGTPGTPGWTVHVVQAPAGSALANSLLRAEDQIKANSTIPRAVDVTEEGVVTLNYNKKSTAEASVTAGNFPGDLPVPGIDPATTGNGNDDYTAEMVAYLDLKKGIYRFGVVSDDGYKVTAGNGLHDAITVGLGSHTGGPANETFDFYVPVSGLYPFRVLWYERAGAAYFELFSVDRTTGVQTLVNDPDSPDSVKAYATVVPPTKVLSSSTLLGGAGSYTPKGDAVVDPVAKTVTFSVDPAASAQFFKLSGATAFHIKDIKIVGTTVILSYE